MILIHTPASPFARKVRVAAIELGLELTLERADPWDGTGVLATRNPALKVPVLIDGAFTLTESTLICQYLDERAHARSILPDEPQKRWDVLRRAALADGMMEATVAIVIETLRRPEHLQYRNWIDRQRTKISNALDHLESDTLDDAHALELSGIGLACALSYLTYRLPQLDWRSKHSSLDAWLTALEDRPSLRMTRP